MKILHLVEFYTPSIGGAQTCVRQLSERLAAAGHEVYVFTSALPGSPDQETINGVRVRRFDVSGNLVRGLKGSDIKRFKKEILGGGFDVAMCYAAQQWTFDVFNQVIDDFKGGKVLVPCGFSGLYDKAYKDYFKSMVKILKSYDASVYLSNDYRDINFARQHKIKNLHVVPNGAAADEFLAPLRFDIRKMLRIPANSFLVLTVGSHTGVKGHGETIEMFRRANIANSCLLMIANDLDGGCTKDCHGAARQNRFSLSARRKGLRILVKDLPREHTVAAYRSADVFLFPSNIEASPLVLFEAMAAKLAFLTTDVGNSREIIEWSGGGQIIPTTADDNGYSHADIAAGAAMLKDLAAAPRRRQQLATNGFKAWEKRFTWEIITKRYEKLYKEVAK